ncbi:hypothetical protein BN1708_019901, partial [Verticillium longisporum]
TTTRTPGATSRRTTRSA